MTLENKTKFIDGRLCILIDKPVVIGTHVKVERVWVDPVTNEVVELYVPKISVGASLDNETSGLGNTPSNLGCIPSKRR